MDILSSVTDEDFTLFRCTYIYIYLLHILFGDDDDENYIIILGAIYSSALLLPPVMCSVCSVCPPSWMCHARYDGQTIH